MIDAVATIADDSTAVFLVNRSLTDAARVLVIGDDVRTAVGRTLSDADPSATATTPIANPTVEACPRASP